VLQLGCAVGSGVLNAGLLTLFGGAPATGFLSAAAGPVGLGVAFGGILIACIDGALALLRHGPWGRDGPVNSMATLVADGTAG
jgi:hypothetical protein